MKRTTISLLAALVTSQSFAQNDWKVSYDSSVKTSYVGGQIPARIYGGPVIQSSVTAAHQGTYAYVWVSSPLNTRWNTNFGSEIDLGIGHDFAISKLWRADVSYAYYDLVPLENARGDLHAIGATLYSTGGKVRPFVRVEQEVAQNPSVLPGGFNYKLGAKWLMPNGLQLQGAAYGNGKLFGSAAETLSALRADVSKDLKLPGTSLTIGLTLQRALRSGGLARSETVIWISTSF